MTIIFLKNIQKQYKIHGVEKNLVSFFLSTEIDNKITKKSLGANSVLSHTKYMFGVQAFNHLNNILKMFKWGIDSGS